MTEKIDPEKLEEIKESVKMDNSRLEELMKIDPLKMTPQEQGEFLNVLKESNLILPIDINFGGIDIGDAKPGDILTTKEDTGFSIHALVDESGNKVIPLFTSDEVMKEIGFRSNCMVMYTCDIADMIKTSNREYQAIVINPNTPYSMGMDISNFLNLFGENTQIMGEEEFLETLKVMLDIIEKHSIELEENISLYVRGDTGFMKEAAVDGVFKPNIPFNVSTRKDFQDELPYLNILLMDAGKKIVHIGNIVEEDHFDTIIAPDTEFEFVEDIDEFTSVWKCGKQPFYDE